MKCIICDKEENLGQMYIESKFESLCYDCQLSIMCQFFEATQEEADKFAKFLGDCL